MQLLCITDQVYCTILLMPFYETNARVSKDPIMGLIQMAAQDSDKNKLTAIVGSAAADNGDLLIPESVIEAAREVHNKVDMAYASSFGLAGLPELMSEEILGADIAKALKESGIARAELVTSGGTNAIATALLACTNKEDQIITHSPHWAGYDSITLAIERKPLINFDILDAEGNFNLVAFETTIKNLIAFKDDAKIILVMNTPFDNPLGKDFGVAAWNEIGEILSKYNDREILIILDTAYLDFGPEGKDYCRLSFIPNLFKKIDSPNFKLVIAGTVSKSFAMYGARVGVATLLSSDQETVSQWRDTAGGCIRGTFSNASRPGQAITQLVLQDPKKLANVHEWQKTTSHLMNKRRDFFIEAMQGRLTEEFKLIRPDSGFFISLMINDNKYQNSTFAQIFYKELLASQLYAPLISDQFLRIPTCGLSESKLEQVANRIVQVAERMRSIKEKA